MTAATSTLTRKADREAFAHALVELAQAEGATASIEPAPLNTHGLWVRIAAGGARVTVTIDNTRVPGWLTPWNVDTGNDRQFSPAFGTAVCADVNPFHRRKCMGYARDTRELLDDISRALRCIAAGEAFQ